MTAMATKTSLKKRFPFVLNLALQIHHLLGTLHACSCSFLRVTKFTLPNTLIVSSDIHITPEDIAAECPVFPYSMCVRIKPSKITPFLRGCHLHWQGLLPPVCCRCCDGLPRLKGARHQGLCCARIFFANFAKSFYLIDHPNHTGRKNGFA